jgi:hypothetical protein
MEPLDTFRIRAGSETRKWDENVVGEHDNVTVTVKDSRVILDILGISDGHQKWRLHINCAMQPENGREALVDNVVEGYMLGRFRFVIVQKPARRLRSLVEQGGENSLEMRRVWLGCYNKPSALVIRAATSEPTYQLQCSFEVFIFHLWRQQGTLRQFSGGRPLARIVLQQPHDNYKPTFSLQKGNHENHSLSLCRTRCGSQSGGKIVPGFRRPSTTAIRSAAVVNL